MNNKSYSCTVLSLEENDPIAWCKAHASILHACCRIRQAIAYSHAKQQVAPIAHNMADDTNRMSVSSRSLLTVAHMPA